MWRNQALLGASALLRLPYQMWLLLGLPTAFSQPAASAASELLPLLYDELRTLARRRMAQENAGHTLQATALVHEAYLRLGGNDRRFANRAHFFHLAAEAMRHILIEHARKRGAAKRGGS